MEKRQLDIERKQRELDAEKADIRAKAVQLLAYPTGAAPRSLPTSASSSISSGPSTLAARAAAVVASAADKRRRQDTFAVAAARAARLDRVRSMVGISHGASRPPLVRDELDDRHARDVGAKRVRFAVDPDAEDDDVVALAAPEDVSRKQWLNQTRRLLLFLARRTLGFAPLYVNRGADLRVFIRPFRYPPRPARFSWQPASNFRQFPLRPKYDQAVSPAAVPWAA